MTADNARRAFLDFFVARGHRPVPSSPLVLPRDPTLLFANAGMNQFKDVFTGREHRDYRRAVSSQKCLRVSGKHNDLEQVGRTPRHHSFFEMLGNFSFGDYFKAEAIEWAWVPITGVWGIPESRLWVTVFGGAEGVPADEEAFALWRDRVGVRPDRILRRTQADTILSGVVYFVQHGDWPLAVVIFTASVFVPVLKIAILAFLAASVQRGSRWRPAERTRLYRITEAIGRWSMVDIYVVTILVALVRLGSLAAIEPELGAVFFGAVVVITMLAAESFDPRLIWDRSETRSR